jgi:RND family efflux transporter MFP subunit
MQKGLALVEQAKSRVLKARSLIRVAQTAVRVQHAKVAESEAGLDQSEPVILLRQKEYDRIEELGRNQEVELRLVDEARNRLEAARSARAVAKAQIIVAGAGLDESQAKLEAAKADLGEVEADLRVVQTELGRATIRASYTRIESPFDGIVTRRGCQPGEFVRSGTEGGSVPVLSIVGARKMKVVVNVPDRDAPFLDKGDPVTVEMDAIEGRKFAGVIARTAFAEDPVTGSLRAEIDLDNNDGPLRPGQAGRVTISLRARDTLAIPVTALFEAPVGRAGACYRVVDGRAVRTLVTRGEVQGDRVEVLKGLKEGDTVVVQPRVSGISDGQIIKSEKRTQETTK